MRLKVPITGTVLGYDPVGAQYDGLGVSGDPDNPITPILTLPNCNWRLISFDLEKDLAEIEVTPIQSVGVLKDGGNPDNLEDWTSRPATEEEKQGFLDYTKNLVEGHTIDELYVLAKAKRLVKPDGVAELWRENPPNAAVREQLLS
ncbi:hypothetical protein ES703_40625 [subsurface metagenome]